MVDNLVVFIPFGLLLGVVFKQTSFLRKLAYIFIFSLATEILQFVFAIGRTDITDVIANTFGGLAGLALYCLGKRYVNNRILDGFIVAVGAILLVTLLLLRVFMLKVQY